MTKIGDEVSNASLAFVYVLRDLRDAYEGVSVRWLVRRSVGPSVGPSVRPKREFLVGQKTAKMNKNEISDDKAGRD